MSDVTAINQVLSQMRALANAAGPAAEATNTQAAQKAGQDFAAVLHDSINEVNSLQSQAGQLSTAFQQGEPGVDIAQVMVSLEKASLSFEAVSQTRNRLLSAYKDIMNMPV